MSRIMDLIIPVHIGCIYVCVCVCVCTIGGHPSLLSYLFAFICSLLLPDVHPLPPAGQWKHLRLPEGQVPHHCEALPEEVRAEGTNDSSTHLIN